MQLQVIEALNLYMLSPRQALQSLKSDEKYLDTVELFEIPNFGFLFVLSFGAYASLSGYNTQI